ncbi:MAG: RDD family protein [Proteobacteria bacterium]|nr:RDD family protein [Pseudomonadota bacterium]MBU1389226.1 RDD family protein [Pseudomonadota bacterium]MBU1544790.1 RDD family protein [Pseudomonadota bacterium]MBU2431718.1 RDD family protein [Pseudomonadota bacterium]MBU2481894.1 RDD family protein [Pseudomonadota bacterium]
MTAHTTNTLTITTPEGIMFPMILAGPVTRFAAWIIDWMCIMALLSFIGPIIGLLGMISPDFSSAVYGLIYFFLSFAYSILTEGFWNGQTLGKRLLHLRVMDIQGLHLSLSQVVIRNLLRAIDGLPALYMVGGISCVITPYSQRTGDLAANTIVVRSPRLNRPELTRILSGKFNSFKAFPHLCARLRQKVSPDLANLVLDARLRRNTLESAARIQVFHQLADHFKSLVLFPETATLGLSDEQYMRNILEILFNDDKTLSQKKTP